MDRMTWAMPKDVPALSMMLEDLGRPPNRAIAKSFGVTEATVRRWLRDDRAPRAVMLSVFWLTKWGRSQVHTEAENAARMHASLHECLRRENAALWARVARLEKLGRFGTANAPDFVPASLQVWGT